MSRFYSHSLTVSHCRILTTLVNCVYLSHPQISETAQELPLSLSLRKVVGAVLIALGLAFMLAIVLHLMLDNKRPQADVEEALGSQDAGGRLLYFGIGLVVTICTFGVGRQHVFDNGVHVLY